MALIELRLNPSERELRWFGLILLGTLGLLGALVLWRTGSTPAAAALGSIGAAVCLAFYGVRPLRLPIYRAWMRLVYPIGWVVSHLVLAAVFYLGILPLGLLLRAFGSDPMQRRFEPEAETYWEPHDPAESPARYFRHY